MFTPRLAEKTPEKKHPAKDANLSFRFLSPAKPEPLKAQGRAGLAERGRSRAGQSQSYAGLEKSDWPGTQPVKKYPPEAVTKQLNGEVMVYFRITVQRQASAARMTGSSGHEALDLEA
ncbi:MAG: energy transducer TonB [Deltaproteobacteria bacterium]|nr:energy transducer TonB [Deltaproteobacteria bacterium]